MHLFYCHSPSLQSSGRRLGKWSRPPYLSKAYSMPSRRSPSLQSSDLRSPSLQSLGRRSPSLQLPSPRSSSRRSSTLLSAVSGPQVCHCQVVTHEDFILQVCSRQVLMNTGHQFPPPQVSITRVLWAIMYLILDTIHRNIVILQIM
jgi:hypothetical protein